MSRFLSFVVRFCRALPPALDRAHLEWALQEIDPMHKDIPYIFNRLALLEARRA